MDGCFVLLTNSPEFEPGRGWDSTFCTAPLLPVMSMSLWIAILNYGGQSFNLYLSNSQ
jgi:hypothetical protein